MTEPTTTERANRARRALKIYGYKKTDHPDDRQDTITDLITDLMHFANVEGYDFATSLRRAEIHFDAENQ